MRWTNRGAYPASQPFGVDDSAPIFFHEAVQRRKGYTKWLGRCVEVWECRGCGLGVKITSGGRASIENFAEYFSIAHSGQGSLAHTERTMRVMIEAAREGVYPAESPKRELFYPVRVKFYYVEARDI